MTRLYVALGVGFFLGIGAQVAMAANGLGRGGLSGPAGGVSNGSTILPAAVWTDFVDAGSIHVQSHVRSSAADSACGFYLPTAGARVCFGSAGAYCSYNSTLQTVQCAGGNGFSVPQGQLRLPSTIPMWLGSVSATEQADILSLDTVGTFEFVGNTANSATAIATRMSAYADLTSEGAKIACFADNYGAAAATKACVDLNGVYSSTAGAGAVGSGGLLVGTLGEIVTKRARVTFDHDDLTDADNSQDVTVFVLPIGAELRRVVMDVTATFTGGGTTDADVICGPTAGTDTYLVTQDVDTAAGTYGDAEAELGTSLTGGTGAIPSWTATSDIVCRFTNTGGTLAALTTGSITFYVYYEALK